ncbi:MAG: hypothetical protein M3294_09195 [Pseudomonadota bacterium]|jgi:hypothetical protein|nr:hypothetical protein [Pseudomonadota bacterium]
MNVFRWLSLVLYTAIIATQVFGIRTATADVSSDLKLLASYRLTDEKADKWAQATRNLVQVLKKHPELVYAKDKVDINKASISTIAAWYDSKPEIKQAINAAGMSSQEYTTFLFSLIQAGMGASLAQSRGLDKLPEGIPRKNVEYYIVHEDKLNALGQQLQQLAPDE